jgi:hypothetical protein
MFSIAVVCTLQYNAIMGRPKKTSNEHQRKTVSFRLPDELMEQVRTLAKRNRRTLSGEVQVAIENHLQGNRADDPPPSEETS